MFSAFVSLISCSSGRDIFQMPRRTQSPTLPAINMRLLKIIKLIATFYRSFFIATSAITVCCIWIFQDYGISTYFALFWFKIATLGLVYYFIKDYKAKDIYYYQNLGVSKVVLWSSTLIFDFSLFLVSIIITYKIR